MHMTVIRLGRPALGDVRVVQAVATNGVAIAFAEPEGAALRLSDVLAVDLEIIGVEQLVANLTTGRPFKLALPERDVHDMRLPSGHGTSRFPSLARRRGE